MGNYSQIKYLLPLFLLACSGKDGMPGSSCSVQTVSNGAIITCTDGTSSVIVNGLDGQDGSNAPPTAYTVVGLEDPCGPTSGFNEVLLRLYNGDLIAHYSSGNLQFLTILKPGNFITTDSQACHFTVDANMQVHW